MSVLYTYIIFSGNRPQKINILIFYKSRAHHTEFPREVGLSDPKGRQTAIETKNCITNLQKLPVIAWGESICNKNVK